MKYTEINKRYTAIVNGYLAQGYMINTATMSGSQGERAHIDLTDGTEVIRIVLQSFHRWEDVPVEGFEIIVGRAAAEDKVVPNDNRDYATVWNRHLEVISTESFYNIGRHDNWFGTKEEALEANRKSFERYENKPRKHGRTETAEIANPKAIALAKQYVLDHRIAKRVDLSQLKVMKRTYSDLHVSYTIEYKGKFYTLH